MLATFERRYLNDRQQEHAVLLDATGELIAARDGDLDSVEFTSQELEAALGGLLSHNHPKGRPLSGPDLCMACQYGLTMQAFGINPEGKHHVYAVRFDVPSRALADEIGAIYDGEVEQARRDISVQAEDWTDELWLQNARHLANTRLAERYGFAYQRIQRNAPISEAAKHELKRLNTLVRVEQAMRDEWLSPLHASIVRALNRHANEKNQIEMARLEMVRREVSGLVQKSMLGQQDDLAPYRIQHGQVIPLSAYFRVLWSAMIQAATDAVERHAAIMRKYLPDDLRRMFENAMVSPFETSVSEMADYDPLHLWLGKDGKQLSDRIWNATGDMRRKLDQYLTEAIAVGKPVSLMAKELEPFLMPGSGSFEAMRLARTEVSAAHYRADSASAQMNPFVETYSPYTAPEHACCDNCDDIVAAGPYPKTDVTHLPPYHPLCICGVLWNIVQNVKAVVDWLREQVKQAIEQARKSFLDYIGPLSRKFLALLFRSRV